MDWWGRRKIAALEAALEVEKNRGLARESLVVGLENYLDGLDDAARKNYLQRWAGFFPTTLKPQLLSMVEQQKNALAMFGLTDRETDIYRANINALRLLLEWGGLRMNEYLGNLEEIRRTAETDRDIISELGKKYN